MNAPTVHYCVSCDVKLGEETKKNTCDYCDEQYKSALRSKRITKKDLDKVRMPRYYSDL